MKLFEITVFLFEREERTFYVVAKTETDAASLVKESWSKWHYHSDAYIGRIELIAEEGQFGKPQTLLIDDEV
ncbi:MAG TPA: hypothetical protein ENJ28_11270 [Gammaproteobacteria bacterium]|nr:hypothetical protein [Gammaproteobacteria bacterium]